MKVKANTEVQAEPKQKNIDSQEITILKQFISEQDIGKEYFDKLATIINIDLKGNEELKQILNDKNLLKKFAYEIKNELKGSKNIDDIDKNKLVYLIGDVLKDKNFEEEKNENIKKDLKEEQSKEQIKEYEKHKKAFNAISDELSKAVDLDNPKYKPLKDKAEQELLKKNPNLKNEVGAQQYNNYVSGLALLLGQETFIKENPNLESKFKELRYSTNFLLNIPSINEVKLNGALDTTKYKSKTIDQIKEFGLKDTSRALKMDNDGDTPSFSFKDKDGFEETMEIDKNSGNLKREIKKDGMSIKVPVENIDPQKQYEEYKDQKDRDNLKNKLSYKINEKGLYNQNILGNIIKSGETRFDYIKSEISKIEQNISKELETEKFDELKDYLEELKKEERELSYNLELFKKIQELNIKLDNSKNTNDRREKNMKNYEEAMRRLNFLDNAGITKFDKQKLSTAFRNINFPPMEFVDFDEPYFGLGKYINVDFDKYGAEKILLQMLNQGISGDKTKPIPINEKTLQAKGLNNAENTEFMYQIAPNGKIDYIKFEENLRKFNIEPKKDEKIK